MARFSSQDNQLINEAYSAQLLKENFSQMTLSQVTANLDEFNTSEKLWVEQFSDRVIEELFGGLKALMGSAGKGIANTAKGVAQKGVDVAKGAARGVKSAATQVGNNVKDIYNSAEDSSKFAAGAKEAQSAALKLVELVKAAQQKGLVTFSGDPLKMPLGELVEELLLAQKGSKQLAASAQKRGVFNGAGNTFRQGFQS